MSEKTNNAICDSELRLGDIIISCAVIDNEENTRVISKTETVKALGRAEGGSKRGEAKLPRFISAKNIYAYLSTELKKAILEPIRYKSTKGSITHGIPAIMLPELCNIWLRAREEDKLTDSQLETAKRAEIIMRGLAHVGIIALVDEATGYQDIRTKRALAEILEKYIAKELRPWVKTFDDSFYEWLYKLRGWKHIESFNKRPKIVGKITNDIIYSRLAPYILERLKEITPKDSKGRYIAKFHQSLTDDWGVIKLREHISNVTTLMKASPNNWRIFYSLLQRALPSYGRTIEIPFEEE